MLRCKRCEGWGYYNTYSKGIGVIQCRACDGVGSFPDPSWSPYPEPREGVRIPVESDQSLRARIINAYGMWGAYCTVVLESSGKRLDELAAREGLTRRGVP